MTAPRFSRQGRGPVSLAAYLVRGNRLDDPMRPSARPGRDRHGLDAAGAVGVEHYVERSSIGFLKAYTTFLDVLTIRTLGGVTRIFSPLATDGE